MKKILLIILTIIISINLFGCQNSKQVNTYEFEYKFKEEYSEIDGTIAAVYLNVVAGLTKVRSSVMEAENQTIDSEFNAYLEETVEPLRNEFMSDPTIYTIEEVEVLKHMMEIAITSGNLQIIKLEYENEKIKESMGLKRNNTEEYYLEQLEDFKEMIETLIEGSKTFIN